MIMMVMGAPPRRYPREDPCQNSGHRGFSHIYVLRGAISDKVIVIRIPSWHAQSMISNPFNMLPEPVKGESHGILVNFLCYPGK